MGNQIIMHGTVIHLFNGTTVQAQQIDIVLVDQVKEAIKVGCILKAIAF
jgi:hypothetical protein